VICQAGSGLIQIADLQWTVMNEPVPTTAGRPRRRLWRWLAPAAAAVLVVGVAGDVLSADAKANLPDRTPQQVLAAASHPNSTGFSGTVVEKASLGLPDLSAFGGASSQLSGLGLLSGSHTIRVWYGGPSQQRVALLDSLGEDDLFRNGASVWEWSSQDRTAVHRVLPSAVAEPAPLAGMSPDQVARWVLGKLTPTTDISTDRNIQVAGRTAYQLVLRPKDVSSRIGQVRIAVDGKTSVPLSFQLFERGASRPALDLAFTRFDETAPSPDNFTWTPPAGVTVKQAGSGARPKLPFATGQVSATTVGSGWTTVLKVTGLPTQAALAKQNPRLAVLAGLLPAVKGSWGSGHLLDSALITVLVTDDGRLYAGAVDPSVLYRAAGQK